MRRPVFKALVAARRRANAAAAAVIAAAEIAGCLMIATNLSTRLLSFSGG